MASQQELDGTYMGVALLYSKMSKCIRAKVGSALVTASGVILPGFNGSPRGFPNMCESIDPDTGEYITLPEIVHAELNCILKAAREGISIAGSEVHVTLSPCVACSAMMVQAQVKRVVYLEEYRDDSGIWLLKNSGLIVEKFKGEI